MPDRVELDGREVVVSDLPDNNGNYTVSSTSGVPLGTIDAESKGRIRTAQNSYDSVHVTPFEMSNAYNATGAPQAMANLQRS